MKANYKIKSGQLLFEVVGNQAKDIWQQVAQIQSLFEAESKCQLCEGTDLRYDYRVTKVGSYKYYELVCRNCGGFFRFGQLRETNEIYPKRKDAQGNYLPNGGWRPASARFGGSDDGEGDYGQGAPPDDDFDAPVDPRQPPPPPAPAQRPPQQPQQQRQPPPTRQVHPSGAPAQGAPQRQQHPTAGNRHNAQDLPYEAPPPRGGYR